MEEAVRGYFFRRYLALIRQPAFAELGARVPSLMIWDDHDIFDGWGSHPAGLQESPVALGLFRRGARCSCCSSSAPTPPRCRHLPRSDGPSFSQDALFPGFCVLLPDLARSARRSASWETRAGRL